MPEHRPLRDIAEEIQGDWSAQGKGVSIHAQPYLDAIRHLDKITDKYGMDDGKSIVLYFLSNAGTWRGPKAVAIKKELKAMVK